MAEVLSAQTLGALQDSARQVLAGAGIESAALDARILVQEATGCSHADLLIRRQASVTPEAAARLADWIARRARGEPVFRILGWREFRGLRLRLSPGVLEPRPDTETLVEHALPFLRDAAARSAGAARLLDLGCGSGAIAIALLSEEPGAVAVGVDISLDALATARRNAAEHGLAARFEARQSRWYEAVEGRFDLILSNPPYIATREIDSLAPEVRLHDPLAALDGGTDGLDAYREISARALEFLAAKGQFLVEIGAGQAEAVRRIFAGNGLELLSVRRDLAGIERSLAFVPA